MIKTSFKRLSSLKTTSSVQIVNPRLGTEAEFLLPNFLHIYIFSRQCKDGIQKHCEKYHDCGFKFESSGEDKEVGRFQE